MMLKIIHESITLYQNNGVLMCWEKHLIPVNASVEISCFEVIFFQPIVRLHTFVIRSSFSEFRDPKALHLQKIHWLPHTFVFSLAQYIPYVRFECKPMLSETLFGKNLLPLYGMQQHFHIFSMAVHRKCMQVLRFVCCHFRLNTSATQKVWSRSINIRCWKTFLLMD